MSKARGLADLGNAYSDGALSNRNVIINGAMQVAQRGTSETGASGYLLDRWKKQSATIANATFNQDTADTPDGFRYALKVLATGSSAYIQLGQAIEFKNMAHVVGKTVTLSYRAKTNLSFDSRIRSRTDTEDAATVFSAATLSVVTESASTAWKLFTHTFTVPTATLAMSVDFSAGALVSGDYFQLTGVQLEVGDTATPFEHRSYGDELARCQRYYWETSNTTNYSMVGDGQVKSAQVSLLVDYPLQMRASPTISALGVNAGSWYVQSGDASIHTGSTAFQGAWSSGTNNQRSWMDFGPLTGNTSGYACAVYRLNQSTANKNGCLAFDAEL